jgi:hypothetical protein
MSVNISTPSSEHLWGLRAQFHGQYCGTQNIITTTGGGHERFWYGDLKARPLERPKRRCKNFIKMDHEDSCEHGNWIHLAQVRDRWRALVDKVIIFNDIMPSVEIHMIFRRNISLPSSVYKKRSKLKPGIGSTFSGVHGVISGVITSNI